MASGVDHGLRDHCGPEKFPNLFVISHDRFLLKCASEVANEADTHEQRG